MIRRCDGTDPGLVARHGGGYCACGFTFDDEVFSEFWPHYPLLERAERRGEQTVPVLARYL